MLRTDPEETPVATEGYPRLKSIETVLSRGAFMEVDEALWRPPSNKLTILFSSTFTDTHMHRDLLQFQILKELRDLARPQGVAVTFVDMRWGVKDENTLDHQTWLACSREIERARDVSGGYFFVSLQAEK